MRRIVARQSRIRRVLLQKGRLLALLPRANRLLRKTSTSVAFLRVNGAVPLVLPVPHETGLRGHAGQRLAILYEPFGAPADLQAALRIVGHGDPDVSSVGHHVLGHLAQLATGKALVGQARTARQTELVHRTDLVRFAGIALAGRRNLPARGLVRVLGRVQVVLQGNTRNVRMLGGQGGADGFGRVFQGNPAPVHAKGQDVQAHVPANLVGVGVPRARLDLQGASNGFPRVRRAIGDVPQRKI